jgi:porin
VATCALLLASAAGFAGSAFGEEAKADEEPAGVPKFVTLSSVYKADLMGPVSGGSVQAGRVLDDLDVGVDFDLEQGLHLQGVSARLDLMMTNGGHPNDFVGSIQGVNNIEVVKPGTRVFQAYVEKSFSQGRGSIRLGFSDLNAEFYATDSASQLIGPTFGVGAELAVTGKNGPSVFPSSSFAVRGSYRFGEAGYLRAGLYNAKAADLGDHGGPDWRYREGVLAIAEAGITHGGRYSIGMWRYSRKADKLTLGAPQKASSQGLYIMIEKPLNAPTDGVRAVTGFVRAGVSDGKTSPVGGGLQAGVRVVQLIKGRADSNLSVGYSYAGLSSGFRAQVGPIGHGEHVLEVAYSDKVAPNFTVQPDLQWVHLASAGPGRDAVVAGLRMVVNF